MSRFSDDREINIRAGESMLRPARRLATPTATHAAIGLIAFNCSPICRLRSMSS